MIGAASERGLAVLVDPARIGDYSRHRGATLVKPNRRETELVTGRPVHTATDAFEGVHGRPATLLPGFCRRQQEGNVCFRFVGASAA